VRHRASRDRPSRPARLTSSAASGRLAATSSARSRRPARRPSPAAGRRPRRRRRRPARRSRRPAGGGRGRWPAPAVATQPDQFGAPARLQRADLVLQAERAGALHRRHRQHVERDPEHVVGGGDCDPARPQGGAAEESLSPRQSVPGEPAATTARFEVVIPLPATASTTLNLPAGRQGCLTLMREETNMCSTWSLFATIAALCIEPLALGCGSPAARPTAATG
jgi:hypothetical protein